jgi:hypothetical protein
MNTELIRRYLFVLISIVYLSLNLSAQDINFYAQTDAKEVFEGSYIELEYILTNAEGRNFKAPSFTNFEVASGPSRASEISIVNGSRSSKYKYGFMLIPKKAGKHTI